MTKAIVEADREPWEKRKGESAKAFAAFALYRDLGPARSHTKVATALKVSGALIARWSSEKQWVDRVDAYDTMVDRRFTDERLTAREQATSREREIAARGLRLVAQRMVGDREANVDAISANSIDSVTELATAFERFTKMRRLADGQATDLVAGAFLIRPAELQEIVRAVVDLALPLLSPENQDRFIRGVEELSTGGGL